MVVVFELSLQDFSSSVQGVVGRAGGLKVCVFETPDRLGFGVPYSNTFLGTCYLKGTIMKLRYILFSPWLLQSPVAARCGVEGLSP